MAEPHSGAAMRPRLKSRELGRMRGGGEREAGSCVSFLLFSLRPSSALLPSTAHDPLAVSPTKRRLGVFATEECLELLLQRALDERANETHKDGVLGKLQHALPLQLGQPSATSPAPSSDSPIQPF